MSLTDALSNAARSDLHSRFSTLLSYRKSKLLCPLLTDHDPPIMPQQLLYTLFDDEVAEHMKQLQIRAQFMLQSSKYYSLNLIPASTTLRFVSTDTQVKRVTLVCRSGLVIFGANSNVAYYMAESHPLRAELMAWAEQQYTILKENAVALEALKHLMYHCKTLGQALLVLPQLAPHLPGMGSSVNRARTLPKGLDVEEVLDRRDTIFKCLAEGSLLAHAPSIELPFEASYDVSIVT
jgi:hypothetical protein